MSGTAAQAVPQHQGLQRCQCGAAAAGLILQRSGLLEMVHRRCTSHADSAAQPTPAKAAVVLWAATKLGLQARHYSEAQVMTLSHVGAAPAAEQPLRLHGVWPAVLSLVRSSCSWKGAEPQRPIHFRIAVPDLSECAAGGPSSGDRREVSSWHWQSALQPHRPLGRQHAPHCKPWHVSYHPCRKTLAACLSLPTLVTAGRQCLLPASCLDISVAGWVWLKPCAAQVCTAAGAFWLTMARWPLTVLSTARLQFSCCRLTSKESRMRSQVGCIGCKPSVSSLNVGLALMRPQLGTSAAALQSWHAACILQDSSSACPPAGLA